jgi:hypothetical protein
MRLLLMSLHCGLGHGYLLQLPSLLI